MDRNLFLSILAMDSYNRGYESGIDFGIGSDEIGVKIGNASISNRSSSDPNSTAVAAGFYALSYTFSGSQNFADGEKVISYRGTDKISFNPFTSDSDVWNGWTLGAGFPDASQGVLSIDFYETVTGFNVNDEANASVTLVGHSDYGDSLLNTFNYLPAFLFGPLFCAFSLRPVCSSSSSSQRSCLPVVSDWRSARKTVSSVSSFPKNLRKPP